MSVSPHSPAKRATEPAWTPRQREVLGLLVRGRTNGQIAEELGISLDRAKWHVSEIITKLNVDSREEAAEYWRAHNGMRLRFTRALRALVPGAMWAKVVAAGATLAVLGGAGVMIVVALQGSGSADVAAGTPVGRATDPTGAGLAVASKTYPPLPTATPTVAPTPFILHPPGTHTGIPIVDKVADALTNRDEAKLKALMHYIDVPWVAPAPGLGGGPFCADGMPVGTDIPVVMWGACEGGYAPRTDPVVLPVQLSLAIKSPNALYAVAEMIPGQPFYGKYLLVFSDPTSSNGLATGTLYVDDQGIVQVDLGCFGTPEGALSFTSNAQQGLILAPSH